MLLKSVMITSIKQKLRDMVSDKKFSEILTGSAWALSGRLTARGLGLITNVIVARLYGADVLGIMEVIGSFLVLATIFSVLGTNTSIMRLIPEHIARHSAASAFSVYRKIQYMVIAASLAIGVVLFFSAGLLADRVFSKPHLSFYFALAAVFVMFKSLLLLNTQAVRGLKLVRIFAVMQLLPQSFNIVLLVLLGTLSSARSIPVYALLGSFALAGISGWIIIEKTFKKIVRTSDPVKPMPAREILSISLPMFMTATINIIGAQTGVIMLGIFSTDSEVGLYSVAVKLATLTGFILAAINSIAAPKFSELFHSGKMDELFYVAKKSAKLIFWTSTPILIGLVMLGRPALSLLFGTEFEAAYPALVFLVIGQFVNSISGCTGFFMNMTGRQRESRNIILGTTVITISLNIIFIPSYGINGAAFACMVNECLWNIATLVFINKIHGQTTGYFPLLAKIQSLRLGRR